jgi:hypothetical protein
MVTPTASSAANDQIGWSGLLPELLGQIFGHLEVEERFENPANAQAFAGSSHIMKTLKNLPSQTVINKS